MVSLERFFKAIFGVQEFVFEIVQLPPSLKKLMDRPLRLPTGMERMLAIRNWLRR